MEKTEDALFSFYKYVWDVVKEIHPKNQTAIRSALFRLFSPCGEIIYVSLKKDPSQPGLLRRTGFVCVAGEKVAAKAIKLDGSDMGGWNVSVRALEQKVDADIPDPLDEIPWN